MKDILFTRILNQAQHLPGLMLHIHYVSYTISTRKNSRQQPEHRLPRPVSFEVKIYNKISTYV